MKDKIFQKAISWTQNRGFSEIKANTEDYETPAVFSRQNGVAPVIPDITGILQGSKSYIEIALKEEDRQLLISKWKLLSMMASRKGGKLYLLAVKGQKTFADKIVEEYDLFNTKVISI